MKIRSRLFAFAIAVAAHGLAFAQAAAEHDHSEVAHGADGKPANNSAA